MRRWTQADGAPTGGAPVRAAPRALLPHPHVGATPPRLDPSPFGACVASRCPRPGSSHARPARKSRRTIRIGIILGTSSTAPSMSPTPTLARSALGSDLVLASLEELEEMNGARAASSSSRCS